MWRDLFTPRPDPSPELAPALADLDRLARDRPELASAATALGRVLSAAFGSPPRLIRTFAFDETSPEYDDVMRAWGSGGTAFAKVSPEFDPDDLRRRSSAISEALKPDNPAAGRLVGAEIDGRAIARGDESGPIAVAERLGVPADLAASIARLAVLPALAGCSASLAPHRPEVLEDAAHCPHCGRLPALAESRGLEGLRFLRCGVCAASWPARRLGCVVCGEADPAAIRSLFVEGEGARHRLVVCHACGFRLKVVSTLGALSAPGILVAELAMVQLDFVDG